MKNKKLLFNVLVIVSSIAILSLTASDSLINQVTKPQIPTQASYDASLEYLTSIRNNQETGTIDPSDVLEAQQMRLKSVGYEQGIEWESAGPDNFAGRTRALLYDKRDMQYNTVYAASTSGGIWKSVTGGITWEPVQGTGNIMNVTTMVQASNGRIYVGTGETFRVFQYAAYAGFMGNGIFVSSETGDAFQALPATVPAQNDTTAEWAYINRLAIHPNNPQVLYAATQTGLKYSNDGGTTWITAKDTANNFLNFPILDVKIGTDGITVATGNSRVYISQNGNPETFKNRSTGTIPAGLPFADVSRIEVALAPGNSDYVYCVVARGGASVGQLENIYLSIDRGASWRVVGPGQSTLFFNLFGPNNIGQYANTAIVHPTNPDIILVGGLNLWQGTKLLETGFYEWLNKLGTNPDSPFIGSNHHVYAFKPNDPNTLIIGTDRGIFRSTDGLATFQNLNRNYITEQCYSVGFNSGKKLVLGTQTNGVLLIPENGNTNGYAERFDLDGLNGGHVFMSVINQNALIWSKGVPTNSTAQEVPLFRSDDLGATTALAPFTPVSTTINNILPAMLFWESFSYPHSIDSVTYFAGATIKADSTVWARSANSRYPFKYTVTQDLNAGDSIRVHDTIASRLFYGLRSTNVDYDVYMTNHGVQFTRPAVWHKILKPAGTPHSFGISNDGDYFWVGTRNGKVYRLSNMNQAQDSLTAAVTSSQRVIISSIVLDMPNRAVTSIAVDPQNNDHVIVTLGNYGNEVYVYRSVDATAINPSFVPVQGDLPKMPVYSSLIEMSNPNIVILGTEMGIYSTTNINAADVVWLPENGGMGNVAVFQLKQQLISRPAVTVPIDTLNSESFPGTDNYGRIYAATFGRGIYKSNHFEIVGINELPGGRKINQTRLNIYPNPSSQIVFVDYDAKNPGQIEISISDLSGRIIVQQQIKIHNSGLSTMPVDISTLKKGVYMIVLNNGNHTISNKLIVR